MHYVQAYKARIPKREAGCTHPYLYNSHSDVSGIDQGGWNVFLSDFFYRALLPVRLREFLTDGTMSLSFVSLFLFFVCTVCTVCASRVCLRQPAGQAEVPAEGPSEKEGGPSTASCRYMKTLRFLCFKKCLTWCS